MSVWVHLLVDIMRRVCGDASADGFLFDPFSMFDDGFRSSEVGIGGCDVVQALMIALMVVVFVDLH